MQTLLTKQVLLARHTSGSVSTANFQVSDAFLPSEVSPGSGDLLIRNLWVSLDPWYRLCMHGSTQGLYMPPFELGKPLLALVVARVLSSDHPDYNVGDIVTGVSVASEYAVAAGAKDNFGLPFRRITSKAPLQHHLGFLGLPGFTAWIAIVKLGQAKPGDEVFISAASGGVGLAAGQIAKLKGCRVVGSAGSDEKVKYLKEDFGFDDAYNYKTEPDWSVTLAKFFPNGIDIYVDNVGGKMLEAVLNNIKYHARIAVSGMISQYEKDWREADGVRNLMNLVGRCARIDGFLVLDHADHLGQFLQEMETALADGKIVSRETVTQGLDNFPSAFVGMIQGNNVGKALIHVAD